MSQFIRTGQPGITNVSPHAGNTKFIIPNRGSGEFQRKIDIIIGFDPTQDVSDGDQVTLPTQALSSPINSAPNGIAFPLPQGATIEAMHADFAQAGPSTIVEFALYNYDPNAGAFGEPTTMVAPAESINVTTTGINTLVLATPIVLPPHPTDLYVVTIGASNTNTRVKVMLTGGYFTGKGVIAGGVLTDPWVVQTETGRGWFIWATGFTFAGPGFQENSIYNGVKDITTAWLTEKQATGVNVIRVSESTVDVDIGWGATPADASVTQQTVLTGATAEIMVTGAYIGWSGPAGTVRIEQSRFR